VTVASITAVAVTASSAEAEEEGIGVGLGGGLGDLGVDEEGHEDGEENGGDVLHGDCLWRSSRGQFASMDLGSYPSLLESIN